MTDNFVIAIFQIVAGLVFGIYHGISIIKRIKYFSKTKLIEGKIIGFRDSLYPVIEYQDEDSHLKKKQYISKQQCNKEGYKVGDTLEIMHYNKGKKDVVYLKDESLIVTSDAIFAVLGWVFVIIGIIILFKLR